MLPFDDDSRLALARVACNEKDDTDIAFLKASSPALP
jgi:hypothetical protein